MREDISVCGCVAAAGALFWAIVSVVVVMVLVPFFH